MFLNDDSLSEWIITNTSFNLWVDRTWLQALYIGNGYDNVWGNDNWTPSGNITYSVDAYGKYADINWDRNYSLASWTVANFNIWNRLNFTQATDFSWACTFSVISLQPNAWSGIFWSDFDSVVYVSTTAWQMELYLRWASITNVTIWANYWWTRLWEVHTVWFSYVASTTRFYVYLDWVLQNVGWTLWPATFLTNSWWIGDSAIWWWNISSARKRFYRAWVWSRTLSDAEQLAFHNAAIL